MNGVGAVRSWYAGVIAYPFPESGAGLNGMSNWQDFSQLVWKSTLRFGCGYAEKSNACPNPVYVCRYSPTGNYLGGFSRNVQASGTCSAFPGCIYPVVGCMSPLAKNYDSSATVQTGATCEFDVPGCTDSTALNFNAGATSDDGSCVPDLPPVVGCMQPAAMNYDSSTVRARPSVSTPCLDAQIVAQATTSPRQMSKTPAASSLSRAARSRMLSTTIRRQTLTKAAALRCQVAPTRLPATSRPVQRSTITAAL